MLSSILWCLSTNLVTLWNLMRLCRYLKLSGILYFVWINIFYRIPMILQPCLIGGAWELLCAQLNESIQLAHCNELFLTKLIPFRFFSDGLPKSYFSSFDLLIDLQIKSWYLKLSSNCWSWPHAELSSLYNICMQCHQISYQLAIPMGAWMLFIPQFADDWRTGWVHSLTFPVTIVAV